MGLPGLHQGRTLYLDVGQSGVDDRTLALLVTHLDEFESVLGCRVRIGPRRRQVDASWVISIRDECQAPTLTWTRSSLTLTSHAASHERVVETIQLLRALARAPASPQEFREPSTPRAAAGVIRGEILGSYPYFDLRGIDRDRWAASAGDAPDCWEDFAPWAQEWVARLGDAHTAVRVGAQQGFNPPYVGSLTSQGLVLETVPDGSSAHRAGVRPGWVVEVEDPGWWLRTTGASPQQRARVAARRALAVPSGKQRRFSARHARSGRSAHWVEAAVSLTLDDILTVDQTSAGVVRVNLSAFAGGMGIEDAFDDLCRRGDASQVMEIDLRGNSGGNLMLAMELQGRFLRCLTHVGWIAHSDGRDGLASPRRRWSTPSTRPCWPGSLRILVDSMTYSAAEDFVLGLQGLEHVTVVGEERTGGGSGRPMTRPLGPGLTLRVSTAITYDRRGRTVEFHGIAPDEG